MSRSKLENHLLSSELARLQKDNARLKKQAEGIATAAPNWIDSPRPTA